MNPQKLDAQGGNGGTAWDDGSDHEGVTKINLSYGGDGIQFVKFDYVKGGEAKEGALHGVTPSRATKKEIVINHPEEYLVSVDGWYDDSVNVLIGIQFTTNLKTSEYIGYDVDSESTKFTLEVADKKIIGFHGFAGNYLNSIGAYFVPIATTSATSVKKLEAKGGASGAEWDDGHHDNVKKVYVGQGQDGIAAVKFEYINGTQVVIGDERGVKTMLGYEDFELEADEYITSVEGTYDQILGPDSEVLTMLIFKTSKNRTSDQFGLEGSTRFEFKEDGHKIVGFHGRANDNIHAIGVYLAPSGTTPIIPATPVKKVEAKGGESGAVWDDGHHDNVKKVYVGQGQDGIAAVKFEYRNGSLVVIGDERGQKTMLGYEDFELESDEYITSVKGTYDQILGPDSAVLTMLIFKTNKNRTSDSFGLEGSTEFEFKEEGYKIAGFHGRANDNIHAIGVYLAPLSTTPLTPATQS